jgi:hypothetical protein
MPAVPATRLRSYPARLCFVEQASSLARFFQHNAEARTLVLRLSGQPLSLLLRLRDHQDHLAWA